MDVVIDTDIIYYLCNKSSDCHFDKNKFLNDMKSNNWNIGITYYSLFEIMNKFSLRQANKDFEGILNFLINNDFGIILDSNLDASSYNILTKCLNKSKKEYYRKKFRNALVPYMAGTLSGFSILFASFWISIISKNEKLYNSEYEQTKRWATENLDKLKNTINNVYIEMLNEYYTVSVTNIKERKKMLKEKINNVILDTFKVYKIIYEYLKTKNTENNVPLIDIEQIKSEIKNDESITLDLVSHDFKVYKSNRNFDEIFESTFDLIFEHDQYDVRYDVIRYIMKQLLSKHTFNFNDIIDHLNILTPHNLKNKSNTMYITVDKNWIQFLSEYKNKNQYYLDLYNFIKQYYQ